MATSRKTLRLLLTTECNLSCGYCCNNLEDVKSRFVAKQFDEIDLYSYDAVCITGGEPLLVFWDDDFSHIRCSLYQYRATGRGLYLYTNGLLLNKSTIFFFDGVTIGIHNKYQVRDILSSMPDILLHECVKFAVQDVKVNDYTQNIPLCRIKQWKMDDCYNNIDTEDWVVLKRKKETI